MIKRHLFAICLIAALLVSYCSATEENDLWLQISSYEDIGITVQDLAFFLVTHGYNAEPSKTYVTVIFSDGKKVYLTPNGAKPGLADLWISPPSEVSGPIMVIPLDAVKKNVTFAHADDQDFLRTISRYLLFPVSPLGMCFDGSQKLDDTYKSFGYSVQYMYDPSEGGYAQGHLWVVVEDPGKNNTWQAVDSYYGPMADQVYYKAPYSFDDIKYLDFINPQWRIA